MNPVSVFALVNITVMLTNVKDGFLIETFSEEANGPQKNHRTKNTKNLQRITSTVIHFLETLSVFTFFLPCFFNQNIA